MDPAFVIRIQMNVQLCSLSAQIMEETFNCIKKTPSIKEDYLEERCQALGALINEETRWRMLMATIAYTKRPTMRTIITADQYKRSSTSEMKTQPFEVCMCRCDVSHCKGNYRIRQAFVCKESINISPLSKDFVYDVVMLLRLDMILPN